MGNGDLREHSTLAWSRNFMREQNLSNANQQPMRIGVCYAYGVCAFLLCFVAVFIRSKSQLQNVSSLQSMREKLRQSHLFHAKRIFLDRLTYLCWVHKLSYNKNVLTIKYESYIFSREAYYDLQSIRKCQDFELSSSPIFGLRKSIFPFHFPRGAYL